MKLLAIDTTETACSAALLIDDDILERFEVVPRRHSELILPMMDELLHQADLRLTDLDGLGVARGPGSFTGVRIASAVIQGAATAADLPVVPVSSLLSLATGAIRERREQRVLAGFDARMNEVYWAACHADENGLATLADHEMVCAPQAVPLPEGQDWMGAGSAWEAYREVLDERLGEHLGRVNGNAMVHAQDVARLAGRDLAAGLGLPAEQALPVYLRDRVAQKIKRQT